MHVPALIQDLAVILGVAAIVTFVFRRIRQPVVLGYIIAGIIVGPHTPAIFSVVDTDSIKVWAELGVIFLMFSLGLEFSFRRLMRVGVPATVTALTQIVAMIVLGISCAGLLGWGRMDAIFLGCMMAISSTTIIIKALEELNLQSKKFAELVFGILIVEDLAAILMLVALSNIAETATFSGVALLLAGLKLVVVVAAWFLVGMFVIPRFVKLVSRHGNDEMLTVVATGLCLALVAVAAKFHYSVALGAFIMGSILAESAEVKRIEHLMQPLRDIFGAVFFVSVGMLLDPANLLKDWESILVVSIIIVLGKAVSVSLGALVTGQGLKTSVQTGFSMAQIGEFSFIIATLGMSYNVIDIKLYPIIVAASLLTTFTTPYLIKSAAVFSDGLERRLPPTLTRSLQDYSRWFHAQSISSATRSSYLKQLTKWLLNAVVVISVFTVAASHLFPVVEQYVSGHALTVTWFIAFLLSSPSLWAMGNGSRGIAQLVSIVCALMLLGVLSAEYFPARFSLPVALLACIGFLFLFRERIGRYYRWLERQFNANFKEDQAGDTSLNKGHEQFALWDAHLIEVRVPARSWIVGKSLVDVGLREKFGLNVVVIARELRDLVAPKASEIIFPGDRLLCFATDSEVEAFRAELVRDSHSGKNEGSEHEYGIRRFKIAKDSTFDDVSIRASGIRERYDCIVVGLERDDKRMRGPMSDTGLIAGDVLWVVGGLHKLQALALVLEA